jgi:hypothetical protein
MPAGITTETLLNFSSFEKICYAFFQIRLRRTEQKKAAYAVAGRFLRRLMRIRFDQYMLEPNSE